MQETNSVFNQLASKLENSADNQTTMNESIRDLAAKSKELETLCKDSERKQKDELTLSSSKLGLRIDGTAKDLQTVQQEVKEMKSLSEQRNKKLENISHEQERARAELRRELTSTFQAQYDRLQNLQTKADGKISDQQSDLTKLQRELQNAQSAHSTQLKQLETEQQSQAKLMQKDINTTLDTCNTARKATDGLQQDFKSLKENISSRRTEDKKTSDKFADSLEAVKKDVQSLNKSMEKQEETIKSLETNRLKELQDKFSGLSSKQGECQQLLQK